MLESYEKRFFGVRSLIEKQDTELKESFVRINELREKLAEEEDKTRKLEGQLTDLSLSNRGELQDLAQMVKDKERSWVEQ